MAFLMERITKQSLVFLKNPSAPSSTCQRTSRRLCSNLLVLVTVFNSSGRIKQNRQSLAKDNRSWLYKKCDGSEGNFNYSL